MEILDLTDDFKFVFCGHRQSVGAQESFLLQELVDLLPV